MKENTEIRMRQAEMVRQDRQDILARSSVLVELLDAGFIDKEAVERIRVEVLTLRGLVLYAEFVLEENKRGNIFSLMRRIAEHNREE